MLRPTISRIIAVAIILVAVVLLASSAMATTGLPWVGAIEHYVDEVSLIIKPDGSGPGLDEAQTAGGDEVDATIRVQLVSYIGDPIASFPFEDLWLQFDAAEGTVNGCLGYPGYSGGVFLADASTDVDGWTEFALPLRGGGWSEGPAWVYVNGSPGLSPDDLMMPPVPLRVNSPDINGDLQVNLTDITYFTQDLTGSYHVRSDFHWDGIINLSDVVVMAQGLGAVCD